MSVADITEYIRAVAAAAWAGAACVFIYAELTLPAVIETAAGCVRTL